MSLATNKSADEEAPRRCPATAQLSSAVFTQLKAECTGSADTGMSDLMTRTESRQMRKQRAGWPTVGWHNSSCCAATTDPRLHWGAAASPHFHLPLPQRLPRLPLKPNLGRLNLLPRLNLCRPQPPMPLYCAAVVVVRNGVSERGEAVSRNILPASQ